MSEIQYFMVRLDKYKSLRRVFGATLIMQSKGELILLVNAIFMSFISSL